MQMEITEVVLETRENSNHHFSIKQVSVQQQRKKNGVMNF
jgi:hypothetical protein